MSATLTIDLDALAANWRDLSATHAGETAAVIKANAYGLYAGEVAPKLAAAGCTCFFTAHLSEAVAVRPKILGARLGVLHGILPGEAADFSAHDLTPVLSSLAQLALWRDEARRLGRILPALLHLDTGMARLGLSEAEALHLARTPEELAGIDVIYVMTHLVSAESPEDEINARQAAKFRRLRALFPAARTSFANSSGLFLGADFGSDLARPGAAIYGINPTPSAPNPMRPVIKLSAPVLRITEIGVGDTVGYNAVWAAARPSRIAVLPVGYADGYLRALSQSATARFDGLAVPLVGRVSMDLSTFDVTDFPQIAPGDVLDLIGPGHDADALALEAGTNGYEILTSLGRRYRRVYKGSVLPA